jgi:hypothetical protein
LALIAVAENGGIQMESVENEQPPTERFINGGGHGDVVNSNDNSNNDAVKGSKPQARFGPRPQEDQEIRTTGAGVQLQEISCPSLPEHIDGQDEVVLQASRGDDGVLIAELQDENQKLHQGITCLTQRNADLLGAVDVFLLLYGSGTEEEIKYFSTELLMVRPAYRIISVLGTVCLPNIP